MTGLEPASYRNGKFIDLISLCEICLPILYYQKLCNCIYLTLSVYVIMGVKFEFERKNEFLQFSSGAKQEMNFLI